ncbi:Predicted protein [Taphrina deformans PYCC 5710]|uniref:DUF300-domain-containing protein n=1 Tax=Taphrina deformans (strain PYCC 5710 / ATCC 11124 / CBS 356.35 / IMI 108563 / JCM 9778 / NBRC 8474) TaxID=1097556 RepID=R4XD76_TAPDE|nr:Predicted protein [Taphrina deformans PYCC 5710]|eukprot:CCG83548.1 Predicted protein [Taphrina deformans PYCC 5710]
MVNTTTITNKIWTDICPADVYGASTGNDVPFWEGVTTNNLSAHQIGWTICGAFAAVNSVFAFWLITQHLRHYNKPQFQRYYVRIILMIPVYSLVSFLGYRYYEYSTYFELGLSFYEAFVIASFFILILNMLSDQEGREKDVLSRGKRHAAMIPLCCIHFHTDSWWFLEVVKWSILQYVVVEPLEAIAGVVLEATGHLCPESFSFQFGHVWLTIIEFSSVTIATYVLIQFYIIIRHDIAAFKPLWKFVAIKLVIFLSFYQSMLLSALGYAGVIKATQYWTQANIEYGLNSLIITIEMFLFCFLDWFAYSYKDFVAKAGPKRRVSMFMAAVDAFNIFDLFVEVGRNLTWFWHAVILRKDHIRHPADTRFDIHASPEHRAELVRQETAAVHDGRLVGELEGEEDTIELKNPRLTNYERADAYDRESDGEEEEEEEGERELSGLRYPGSTHQPTPYVVPQASAYAADQTRYGNPARTGGADARVSRYLRETRLQDPGY